MERLNPHLYMCIVPFPWYGRRKTVEWGVGCNGCKIPTGAYAEMDREEFWKAREEEQNLYSKGGYLGHMMVCPKAIAIFQEKFRTDIFCEVRLLPSWKPSCHLAGDPSHREPHPSDDPADDGRFRANCRADRKGD
jgi:hypothetical protein